MQSDHKETASWRSLIFFLHFLLEYVKLYELLIFDSIFLDSPLRDGLAQAPVRMSVYLRRFVMNDIIKSIEDAQLKAEITPFRVGDTVKVHSKVKEGNRERIQVFEGTVLKRQGGSNRETFTVRKISNGVGVEKTWPLHSPIVEKIEVVRKGKVRRAKLNYLRQRIGKAARVKERV